MRTPTPTFVELANRLEADLRKRSLQPGDPFLATADAARLLRVSCTSANKALQVLAKRGLIERKQRRGSVVAEPPAADHQSVLRTVHVLVNKSYIQTEGVLVDGTLLGLQSALPGVRIMFDTVPAIDEDEFLKQLIADALRADGLNGFVLVLSSLLAQRMVANSELPAVVFGSLYPSISGLSSVCHDYGQSGRLLGQYLLDAGCRRLAVLNRQTLFTGDHHLFEGVLHTVAAAELSADALTMRCLPPDEEAIFCAARDLIQVQWQSLAAGRAKKIGLKKATGPKIGLVCRNVLLADGAARAAQSLGLKAPDEVAIVVSRYYRQGESPPRYPYAKPTSSPEQQGEHLGRLLARQAQRGMTAAEHEVVPMSFELPSN